MELTRTDAVFSRTIVVLFFVQKWKFSKWKEIVWWFFWNKIGTRSFVGGPEGEGGGHHPLGRTWRARRTLVGCAPLGAPPRCCYGPMVLFWSIKNPQQVSRCLENFDFCTKNNTTVVLLKTASVWVSSMQIIPKPYKFFVNMAWILHKL